MLAERSEFSHSSACQGRTPSLCSDLSSCLLFPQASNLAAISDTSFSFPNCDSKFCYFNLPVNLPQPSLTFSFLHNHHPKTLLLMLCLLSCPSPICSITATSQVLKNYVPLGASVAGSLWWFLPTAVLWINPASLLILISFQHPNMLVREVCPNAGKPWDLGPELRFPSKPCVLPYLYPPVCYARKACALLTFTC